LKDVITDDSLRATFPDEDLNLVFDRFERIWIAENKYEKIERMQRKE